MLELGSSGSARGVSSNGHPYRDRAVIPFAKARYHYHSELPIGISRPYFPLQRGLEE